jgi:TrpR-related protein YerC/YecD
MMAYESKVKPQFVEELYEAILKLETAEECSRFFEDLCTIKEIQSLSQRLKVAKLLKERKTYTDIESITHASTATISRVNRCFEYGANGYKLMLEKLDNQKK